MKKKNTGVVLNNGTRTPGELVRHRYYPSCIPVILCVIVSSIFTSCVMPVPEPRYIPKTKKDSAVTAPQQFLPDGWADITSRSQQPQIKLWLVNRDVSATMVLRELQTDERTREKLKHEEMNLIATVSLHGRITSHNPDVRVTKAPEIIDVKRNFSSYVYSENGLLRWVVVFRKKDVIMELELVQERSDARFDALTADLIAAATVLFDR